SRWLDSSHQEVRGCHLRQLKAQTTVFTAHVPIQKAVPMKISGFTPRQLPGVRHRFHTTSVGSDD
ncbi:MAG TPA: hypothetical protein VFX83_08065, partial [Azonexus sp.]|nr:hypothetical protein [Azonexus sp.]